MFYSSSSSDEDDERQSLNKYKRTEIEKEDGYSDPLDKGTKLDSLLEDEPSPRPISTRTPNRPSTPSSRQLATRRALELEQKRKARRGASSASLVKANESPARPAAATSAWGEDSVARRDSMSGVSLLNNKAVSEVERELEARGISPSYDPHQESTDSQVTKPKKEVRVDLSDIRSFLMSPAPKGAEMIRCRIERDKGTDKLHPHYYLYLEETNQFLLAARKRKKSKTSNYLVSLEKDDLSRTSGNYIGKIRSNFMGTEFLFYDKGDAPSDSDSDLGIRQELGAVVYSSNMLGLKGPRKMRIILPALKEDDTRIIWKPMKPSESIAEKFKLNDTKNMMLLVNKSPSWNEETKSYVLNFNNRVKQASVKNFQVVFQEDADTVLMQFGRVSGGVFSMDFQYPFSLFQAFAVALTSFDNKIACE